MPDNKPRLPRVERAEEFHIEDETGHLWAVSYADFLMVLLSFFILFFSVEDQEKQDVIQKILSATTESDGSGLGPGKGPGDGGDGVGYRDVASIPSDALKKILEKHKIKIDKNDKRVIFMFEDDAYRLGQVGLSKDLENQITTLLDKLLPYSNDVDLTFVGHTDIVPLRNRKTALLNDNFALSVLRATRAVQYAVKKGFPADRMAAKGSAEKKRNTRSLSLIISPRNESI